MKQKAITIILTILAILPSILILPTSILKNCIIGKMITLMIGGGLLLILLLASYKTLKIDIKDILILIFLGLVFLSTIFSTDIKKSIFGENDRYEGLLMFVTYVCIYMCAKKIFNYSKLTRFLNIMFYVSMVIGILGIVQNYIKIDYIKPIFSGKVSGTFGNPNFFGSYISIVLPITLSIFIHNGNKKSFLLSLVMFFNMIACTTRSAWVAFIIVMIITIVYLIKEKNKTYLKRTLLLIFSFGIIFIYLLNGFNFIKINSNNNANNTANTVSTTKKAQTATKKKIDQVAKEIQTASKKGIQNTMGSGRIQIWKMAIKVIEKNPILGCGVDNFHKGLINNCLTDYVEYAKRTETKLDKVHNEYLHIATTIGIPALIIYLIFIGLILIPKIKLMMNNKASYIITLAIISYLVQAFFNISTIGVAPIFWMILGLSDNTEIMKKLNQNLIEIKGEIKNG